MSGREILFDSAERDRLVKLLGMLGSAHDGEIAAAGRKAHELIKRNGLQWHDVIIVPVAMPPWRAMVDACLAAQAALNRKERQFLHSLLNWRGTPTPKQMAWLTRIFEAVS